MTSCTDSEKRRSEEMPRSSVREHNATQRLRFFSSRQEDPVGIWSTKYKQESDKVLRGRHSTEGPL